MFGKNTITPLVIMIAGLILLVINLVEWENGNNTIWGIISNLLLIIAMVMVILDKKKKPKE